MYEQLPLCCTKTWTESFLHRDWTHNPMFHSPAGFNGFRSVFARLRLASFHARLEVADQFVKACVNISA